MTEKPTTETILLGSEEEPAEVLRAIFKIVEELGLHPHSVVWIGEDRAVQVPAAVAEKYTTPEAPKRARKAAKAAPPPPPDDQEE